MNHLDISTPCLFLQVLWEYHFVTIFWYILLAPFAIYCFYKLIEVSDFESNKIIIHVCVDHQTGNLLKLANCLAQNLFAITPMGFSLEKALAKAPPAETKSFTKIKESVAIV